MLKKLGTCYLHQGNDMIVQVDDLKPESTHRTKLEFEHKALCVMLSLVTIRLLYKKHALESSLIHNRVDQSKVQTLDRSVFQLIFPYLDVKIRREGLPAQLIPH